MDFFFFFFRTFFFINIEIICRFLKNFKFIKNLLNKNNFFFFFFKSFNKKILLENYDDTRYTNFFKKYIFLLKYYIKLNIYKSSSELKILKNVLFYFLPKFFRNILFKIFFLFRKYILKKNKYKKNFFRYKKIFFMFNYLNFFENYSHIYFEKKNYKNFLFFFIYFFLFFYKKIFLTNIKIHITIKNNFFYFFFLVYFGNLLKIYTFNKKMIVTVMNKNIINKFINNAINKLDLNLFFIFSFDDLYLFKKNSLLDQDNVLNLNKYKIIYQKKNNNLNFTTNFYEKLIKKNNSSNLHNHLENEEKLFFSKFNYNFSTVNDLYPYRLRKNLNFDNLIFKNFFKLKFEEDDKNKGKLPRNKQNYRTGVFLCIWLTIITVLGLYFYFYFLLIKYSYLFFVFLFFIFYFFYKFFIFKKKNQKIFYLIEL